jgi:tetratricopeptide (TPR) repeat protein
MLFVILLPIFLLFGLGILSIHLTRSDYIAARPYVGGALLGITGAVFCLYTIGLGRTQPSAGALFGSLFYNVLLAVLLAMQIPLILELISQAILPNPGKNLRLLRSYSAAEKKILQGDLPGAIAEYEEALKEVRDDTDAHFRLAELYFDNGDYGKAAKTYETALASAKKLGKDQHCLALTRLSEIYKDHLHDTESARKHLQTIIEKYPETKYAGYATDRIENL